MRLFAKWLWALVSILLQLVSRFYLLFFYSLTVNQSPKFCCCSMDSGLFCVTGACCCQYIMVLVAIYFQAVGRMTWTTQCWLSVMVRCLVNLTGLLRILGRRTGETTAMFSCHRKTITAEWLQVRLMFLCSWYLLITDLWLINWECRSLGICISMSLILCFIIFNFFGACMWVNLRSFLIWHNWASEDTFH